MGPAPFDGQLEAAADATWASMNRRFSSGAFPSKMALPETMRSGPSAATHAMFAFVIPPSTPTRIGRSVAATIARARARRFAVAGATPWDPTPG